MHELIQKVVYKLLTGGNLTPQPNYQTAGTAVYIAVIPET